VVSVVLSRPALEALRRNFEANGATDRAIASCRHSEVASDAFEAMESMVARGELFEIVIVDPPAFARRPEQLEAGLESYARLAGLGAGLTRKDGTLLLAPKGANLKKLDITWNGAKKMIGMARHMTP
jgi:23S rRNA (cytosine1962-C5)-methyltransferase